MAIATENSKMMAWTSWTS